MDWADWSCLDCGLDTFALGEYYMVEDDVWLASGLGREEGAGLLCIGCLEWRLRRRLDWSDFPLYPVNEPQAWQSGRLQSRLDAGGSY